MHRKVFFKRSQTHYVTEVAKNTQEDWAFQAFFVKQCNYRCMNCATAAGMGSSSHCSISLESSQPSIAGWQVEKDGKGCWKNRGQKWQLHTPPYICSRSKVVIQSQLLRWYPTFYIVCLFLCCVFLFVHTAKTSAVLHNSSAMNTHFQEVHPV